MPEDDIRIGTTTRDYELAAPVTLTQEDLAHHLILTGATGSGKTTLVKTLIYHQLKHDYDFAVLDPLGGLAEAVVDAIPIERTEKVIYWNPGGDLEHCIGFNPLYRVPRDRRHLAADGVVAAFLHIWDASLEEAPRLTYWLYSALRLLLDDEREGATLLGLPRLFIDERYRAFLIKQCQDPVIRTIWNNEYTAMDYRFRVAVISPIQNKIGMLLAPPPVRNVLAQRRSTLDLRRLMNGGGVLICNLGKGYLGQTGSKLIGALVATTIAQVAEERVAIPSHERRPFTLFADELQNYATPSFASTLSEARQFGLALVGAHQYLSQLPQAVQDALTANAGTKIVYRVSSTDAQRLAHDLDIDNFATLSATANYQAWCKILRYGVPSDAILVRIHETIPPVRGRARKVKAQSNAIYTRPRAQVEAAIARQLSHF